MAAIRASQLNLKVAVVEKDSTFGGTCLNIGCIPSKALLESSEQVYKAQHEFKDHGIHLEDVSLNLNQMMSRKERIVFELTQGIEYLFKKNKISSFRGWGSILTPTEVAVNEGGNTQILKTKNILLATGSVPNHLPHIPVDKKNIITSTEALSLKNVPQSMTVLGGGAIGLEMASVWSRLGTKVTLVEYKDHIAGGIDKKMSRKYLQILKKQGIEFLLGKEAEKVDKKTNSSVLTLKDLKTGGVEELASEVILVAVGRLPFHEGLGLERVGIKPNKRGFVEVDSFFRTSQKNIYAIGDVIPGPMLAHKAEEEGVAVAEIIAGKKAHVHYYCVPFVIYTEPEMAYVGFTEEELKDKGHSYKVGEFPFLANGRAKSLGSTDGFIKVLADKKTDKILGVHILGPRASDLLQEGVLGMEFQKTSKELAETFHSHPSLSEALREAFLDVNKNVRQM